MSRCGGKTKRERGERPRGHEGGKGGKGNIKVGLIGSGSSVHLGTKNEKKRRCDRCFKEATETNV